MTVDEVLEFVQEGFQLAGGFAPALFVIGVEDKQVVLFNTLQGKKPHEQELMLEFTGTTVASSYDLGELARVYYVSVRTVRQDDDLKGREVLFIDRYDVGEKARQVFIYRIKKMKKGRVSLILLDGEICDPWADRSLLSAFVKGYQEHLGGRIID